MGTEKARLKGKRKVLVITFVGFFLILLSLLLSVEVLSLEPEPTEERVVLMRNILTIFDYTSVVAVVVIFALIASIRQEEKNE